MKKDLIQVKNVTKMYGPSMALNGANIHFLEKEEYAIRGASGSGKSTLLYLLGGLDRPTSGEVIVNGSTLNDLSDEELALYRNRFVGFVFQFHFLLPSMTIWDNILLPSRLGLGQSSDLIDRINVLAHHLGVRHCLKKFPYELSGGEQQRINIIRALSLRPRLLLCDEPTGNLDSQNSARVIDLLRSLSKEYGATLIVVTHDLSVAETFANQLFMKDGIFFAH